MNRRQFIKVSLQAGALAMLQATVGCKFGEEPIRSTVSLLPLPYAQNALEPYISARALSFHHGQHHKAYVEAVNRLAPESRLAGAPLEEIIAKTRGKKESTALFNNAAQVFNHDACWQSMTPGGGGAPQGVLADRIRASFGSFDSFCRQFTRAAGSWFGSGWAWLVADNETLRIVCTANADCPLDQKTLPLLTLDLWEHAYYLDYQNRRGDYIDAFLKHLVNWEYAAKLLGAGPRTA